MVEAERTDRLLKIADDVRKQQDRVNRYELLVTQAETYPGDSPWIFEISVTGYDSHKLRRDDLLPTLKHLVEVEEAQLRFLKNKLVEA